MSLKLCVLRRKIPPFSKSEGYVVRSINPYGFPIANTCSPTLTADEFPNCTGTRDSITFSDISYVLMARAILAKDDEFINTAVNLHENFKKNLDLAIHIRGAA
jgi:hypothetical protein